MLEIKWIEGIEAAGKEAGATGKPVLMFFHHPMCGGCKKTLSTTFTDPDVVELLDRDFVMTSFLVTEAQDLTARYAVEWTPTFLIADQDGKELERWVGYLPPADFIAQIHLSEGLAAFHRNRFKDAEEAFSWIIDNKPDADVAPEARYYLGVSLYKETGDGSHLERTWEAMSRRYPDDFWTKKASAWSK